MPRQAIHPGRVLAKKLESVGITPSAFARQLDVPPNRITQIINGQRAITGDTALRLAHWFATTAEFWLNLQTAYDLDVANQTSGAWIRRLPTQTNAMRDTANQSKKLNRNV